MKFQFTCPSRSTTQPAAGRVSERGVSIHVPLAEHDGYRAGLLLRQLVSIHVPLAEHDVRPSHQ